MNVIVLMADSLRKDHLGCYGNPWIRTPNIDGLAAQSVVFDEAYPESLPTLPVRNAMLSGRHCGPELGWGPMRESDVRLPEILAEAGCTTAMVTDVYHMMKPGMNFHRGFHCWRWIRGQEQDAYRTAPNPSPPVPGEYCEQHDRRLHQFSRNVAGFETEADYFTARVYDSAIEWIERNYRQGGFFLWVDSFDPHEPWFPPYYYSDLYDPDYEGVEPIGCTYGDWTEHLTPRQLKRMRAHYAGEVTFLDRYVGKLLAKLVDLGIDDETLIVLISDHGHVIGEHGLVGKNWDTNGYREVMDLVLMVRFPRREGAGRRVAALCYNIDVVPTVLSHLGVEPPEAFDGRDLRPVIAGEAESVRDAVTCSYITPGNMMVKTLDWTLLYDEEHSPLMLFDRAADPAEEHNVLADRADVVAALQQLEQRDWQMRPQKPAP
jgi:arylsulfatase A-like enzyme